MGGKHQIGLVFENTRGRTDDELMRLMWAAHLDEAKLSLDRQGRLCATMESNAPTLTEAAVALVERIHAQPGLQVAYIQMTKGTARDYVGIVSAFRARGWDIPVHLPHTAPQSQVQRAQRRGVELLG